MKLFTAALSGLSGDSSQMVFFLVDLLGAAATLAAALANTDMVLSLSKKLSHGRLITDRWGDVAGRAYVLISPEPINWEAPPDTL